MDFWDQLFSGNPFAFGGGMPDNPLTPQDATLPFAPMERPKTNDPIAAFAGGLAQKGITPDQFMQNPSAYTPQESKGFPPLGESLTPPLPRPAPVPSFGDMAAPEQTSIDMSAKGQPRGIRNNNPLNIEAGPFTQSQEGYAGSDGRFAKFDTPEQGKAAANALLDTYQTKYGLTTPNQIISRWAPASDGNDTTKYAQYVADKLGIKPDEPVPPEKRDALIQAMSEYENGQGSGSTTASAKTKQPSKTVGQKLKESLAGIKAPPPPQVPRVGTPSAQLPHVTPIKTGGLEALLQTLGTGPQTRRVSLASAVRG